MEIFLKDIEMHETFDRLAAYELEAALSKMPSNSIHKLLLFTEITRALDYWAVCQYLLPEGEKLSEPDSDLIQLGWNLALEHLFVAIDMPGVPIAKDSDEGKLFAINLLHTLGRSVLLRRTSEMTKYGLVDIENHDKEFIIRKNQNAHYHFRDALEFHRLAKIEKVLSNSRLKSLNGWKLIGGENISESLDKPGAFLGQHSTMLSDAFGIKDIDNLMESLVFPWDSGFGIVAGYHADPKVDDYFLAQVTDMVGDWRREAGIHPNSELDGIIGADLTLVIIFLVALHIKHVSLVMTAMKKYPEISATRSLTIWGPINELVESIAGYCEIDKNTILRILSAVTMRASDVPHLDNFTTPFLPLLIDLGQGKMLRPVSSLLCNPFISAITLQKWRNPSLESKISAPREGWMRDGIYSLFQGTRYVRVDGNIKIRDGRQIVTDIDGAIYDVLTGELALFQLKWQDYSTNDIRMLRSKARNLTCELDAWAEKIESWVKGKGRGELAKALRLRVSKGTPISDIYLFGISQMVAHVREFGFLIKNEGLALANWGQLVRLRYEIGPADRVFRRLFDALKAGMDEAVNTKGVPVTIKASDHLIRFEDMWNILDDERESE